MKTIGRRLQKWKYTHLLCWPNELSTPTIWLILATFPNGSWQWHDHMARSNRFYNCQQLSFIQTNPILTVHAANNLNQNQNTLFHVRSMQKNMKNENDARIRIYFVMSAPCKRKWKMKTMLELPWKLKGPSFSFSFSRPSSCGTDLLGLRSSLPIFYGQK